MADNSILSSPFGAPVEQTYASKSRRTKGALVNEVGSTQAAKSSFRGQQDVKLAKLLFSHLNQSALPAFVTRSGLDLTHESALKASIQTIHSIGIWFYVVNHGRALGITSSSADLAALWK